MAKIGQEIIFKDLCESQFNGNYDDMVDWLNKYNCNKKVIFISKYGMYKRRHNGDPFITGEYCKIEQPYLDKLIIKVLLARVGWGEAMGLEYVDNDFVYAYDVENDHINNDTGIKWYVNGRFIVDDEF